jgi:iron complex transport system permease protein
VSRAHPSAAPLRLHLGPLHLRIEMRTLLLCIVLAVVVLAGAITSLTVGTIRLGLKEAALAVVHRSGSRAELVVWKIRLPRAVTGIAVGAALGAAGCVFQSISRNALGSPDVIGFTTGAATGAVLQIVFLGEGPVATALAAVGAGGVTAVAVYLLSRHQGTSGGYRLVLVGIGVSAMLGAVNTMVLAYGDLDLATKARIWLSGSLNARTWADAAPAVVAVIVCIPVLIGFARRLDVLEMGDDQARQLGVHAERTRMVVMLVGVALTAASVAAAGPIAFVALAAPQVVGRITLAARVQVVGSALTGAALLVLADLLSTTLPVGVSLPVGLVTGVIGGVYLIWLLTRQRAV